MIKRKYRRVNKLSSPSPLLRVALVRPLAECANVSQSNLYKNIAFTARLNLDQTKPTYVSLYYNFQQSHRRRRHFSHGYVKWQQKASLAKHSPNDLSSL